MLQAQLLPELTTDWRERLSAKIIQDFPCTIYLAGFEVGHSGDCGLGFVAVKVRGREQHTVVAALASLDRDDFPAKSIGISTYKIVEGSIRIFELEVPT
jgi:hypothetical protein